MGRELNSLSWLYKSHKRSGNKQKSPYSKKGGNHLLFLGLEYKGGRSHVIASEEWTTTSALLKSCSWERRILRVTLSRDQNGLVTWESSSNTETK